MSAEPRVLFLTPDFPPERGGIQILAHRLVSHVRRIRPTVLAPAMAGATAFDAAAGVPVVRAGSEHLPRAVRIAAMNARGLWLGLRRRPDVVVSLHIVAGPAAIALRRLRGTPYVQYVYAREMPGRPTLARWVLRRADRVVAISEATRQIALDYGARPEALRLVPPGVDPLAPRTRPPSGPLVLTVARLEDRYKGHDVLLRALPVVRARVPGARWAVVGDGPLRPYLEALASALGVAEHVDFHGAVSDARRDELLAAASVFAMPSRNPPGGAGEGFGIVFLEAAMRGLPSVAANVGGSVDAVVDGQTGLLVDPADHLDVAHALIRLLEEPEVAGHMAERGRARAQEFRWDTMAAAIEEIVFELR